MFCALIERIVTSAAAILQVHVEAAELAQAADRRQVHDERLRVLDAAEERAIELLDQMSVAVVLAIVPGLKRKNARPTFSPWPTKLKPAIANTPSTAGFLRAMSVSWSHDLVGARDRGAGRQLDDRQRVTLVFLGHEAAGQAHEQEAAEHDDDEERAHPRRRMADRAADMAGVGALRAQSKSG